VDGVSGQAAPGREELFLLPAGGDAYYLYAPLRRVVASLNRRAVAIVSRYLRAPAGPVAPEDEPVLADLRRAGLFSEPAPAPPTAPGDYLFRPHEVTLFPTTRCNLRCVYCYADAGRRRLDMPFEVARAAIDLVVENARAVGREDFILGFHGGGEPTAHWPLVKRATLHALERARENGLVARIHCATNGVLTPTQREFILRHFTGLNVSLDGPADIQNRQRPLASGRGSFDRVMQTLDDCQRASFPFGIRVTLTAGEVHRLGEIVRFVHERFPGLDQLHVEPVWQCGRCQTTGARPPGERELVDAFAAAWNLARELGVRLFYSGARLDVLTDRFCAAPGDGFAVTPEGLVSSCFEVVDPDDPRAALFHYGRYVAGEGRFALQPERVERLRGLRVANLPHCRDCFCKWHCAGDCLAKALAGGPEEEHAGSPRCGLNRELTLIQLDRMARTAPTGAEGHRPGEVHGG